jgi:hypothetical protein
MSLDRELFDWIAMNAPLQKGVEFFRGPIPEDSPDEAIALIYRGGRSETATNPVAEAAFQVYIRAWSQDKILHWYRCVRELLMRYFQVVLLDRTMFSVTETSSGFVGMDGKGRYVFSSNFTVRADRVL